jgi:N-acetylmuramoyl-L-alanine amidase
MFKIVIDPGHGQYNNPGCCKGYYEGTQMHKLGVLFVEELNKYADVSVTFTRPSITDNPALDVRGKMALGHNLLLSLHSNAPASATNTGPNGVAVYDSFERPNVILAKQLLTVICNTMGSVSRGVQHRENTRDDRRGQDYYGVLRNAVHVSGCPSAMLIEHGFHTNPRECAWLMDTANLKRLAEAEVAVIAKHYSLSKKGDEDMIRAGEQSANVGIWQRVLLLAGFDLSPYNDDGKFGPLTQQRTRELLNEIGLPFVEPLAIGFPEFFGALEFVKAKEKAVAAETIQRQDAEIFGLSEELKGVNAKLDDIISCLAFLQSLKPD